MDKQEWTIMIYMAGDNNLSVDMAYAMQQIKDVAGEDTENVNLFVYYDGYSSAIPTLYCDFSDSTNPKHIRSYMVKDKLFPVESIRDESAADEKSVLNFVDWCVNKVGYIKDGEVRHGRKAERYALIFSGHSMGFQDIGLFKDETSEKTMSMTNLNWLLQRLTKTKTELIADAGERWADDDEYQRETAEILGQKLDILGFDSCVMGMLEVGHQFNGVAKTMIASEGSVPSAGWTYAKILGNLAHQSKGIHVNDIAANFVSEFVRSQDSYTIGGVSVDMAAWDLGKLPDLSFRFEKVADALLECLKDPNSTICRQIERVLLQVHWKCQSYMFDQNVDLGDFCELLRDECYSLENEVGGEVIPYLHSIEAACCDVLTELKNVVILSGFSGGTYQYSNGISLFFPWSLASYEVSLENYETLRFVVETSAGERWNRFLDRYLRDITFRHSPGPTEIGNEPASIILESILPMDTGPEVSAYSAPPQKLRYYSYQYQDSPDMASGEMGLGLSETKMAGAAGTKMGGAEGTKMGGAEGTKMGGAEGTKMGGAEGTKMGGAEGTKMGGAEGTKMAGAAGTKMGGAEGTKIGGAEGTKMGGAEGSKMGGAEGTKMAGAAGTKMGGAEGTKMAGAAGTKIAGGGSDSFFSTFKVFKNIETPWNISGFTKEPRELAEELKADKTSGGK